MPTTTRLEVTATEPLTPGMVRIRFRSDDLAAFADSAYTDRYVKLQLGTEDAPVLRTYTALDPVVEPSGAGTLTIDFVVHGDEGHAGPWAAAARPGDTIEVRGPGGAYAPDPTADWHLLAGDEAALPALRAALELLLEQHPDAVGEALVAVPDEAHRQPLPAPAGIRVTWVPVGSLAAAVRDLAWREGRVQVFVHGEGEEVMKGIRPHLLGERGVDRATASISGYWRRGDTDEAFRTWKRQLAAAEAG